MKTRDWQNLLGVQAQFGKTLFTLTELANLSGTPRNIVNVEMTRLVKYGVVARSKNVTLEALDEHGKPFTRGAGGLLAQIIQHECDHLDGTLFIDRAVQTWNKEDRPSNLSEARNE